MTQLNSFKVINLNYKSHTKNLDTNDGNTKWTVLTVRIRYEIGRQKGA